MNSFNPVLSIIIVSYNTKDDLKQCIEGLLKESDTLEVYVIDNASVDGSVEMIESYFKDKPAIHLIKNNQNVGFTPACNQPLLLCKGQYILFLNSDTINRSKPLSLMVDYMNNNLDVGVLGPKLFYGDGSLQLSSFPKSEFLNLLNIILWHLLTSRIAESLLIRLFQNGASLKEKDVGWVSGACLLIRKELVLKLGGFDENFFLSAQDSLDLCKRVRNENYRVVYYPKAEVVHYCGRSSKGNVTVDKQVRFFTHMHQGHLYYYYKYYGIVALWSLKLFFSTLSLCKALVAGILFSVTFSDRLRDKSKARLYTAVKILMLDVVIK